MFNVAEAVRKKRRGHSAKQKRKHSLTQFMYIMIIAMLCVFVPILAYFAYSVARDPMTPVVLKQLWQHVKERCTGYLGKKRNESTKSKKERD